MLLNIPTLESSPLRAKTARRDFFLRTMIAISRREKSANCCLPRLGLHSWFCHFSSQSITKASRMLFSKKASRLCGIFTLEGPRHGKIFVNFQSVHQLTFAIEDVQTIENLNNGIMNIAAGMPRMTCLNSCTWRNAGTLPPPVVPIYLSFYFLNRRSK